MEFDKENKNDFWAQAKNIEVWEKQSLNSIRSIGKNRCRDSNFGLKM